MSARADLQVSPTSTTTYTITASGEEIATEKHYGVVAFHCYGHAMQTRQ
jgi:hypothetical protein